MQNSITVDGFELPYHIEGTGQDVIVIGDTVYYPRTFSDNLRQHVRLHFLSHRGFSTAHRQFKSDDFALEIIANDIEAYRIHHKLEQVIVLGHSGHGHMALSYAQHYPQHVTHAVIVAMSPDSSQQSFAAADRYLEESVSPARKQAFAESMALLSADIAADPQRRFIHYSLRSGPRIWYNHTYDARPLWEGVQVIPEVFDHVWGELLPAIDITTHEEALKKPVFVCLGRYDFWNPPHLWEPVRASFGDLHLRVFERSGHTPQLEEPAHFDRELLSWLSAS